MCLSAKELLGSDAGIDAAKPLLSQYPLTTTLSLLCRASFVVHNTPYRDLMTAQRHMAGNFHPEELLKKANEWIKTNRPDGEALLFAEQPLLTAMVLALLLPRRRRTSRAQPPFESLGRALLHIMNDVDLLQRQRDRFESAPSPERRKLLIEYLLRNGLFNAHDDYRRAIARTHEMLVEIAPSLAGDPNYLDLLTVFRQATGLALTTYLSIGLVLLASPKAVTIANADPVPVFLNRRLFKTSPALGAARKLLRSISATPRQFRKAVRLDRQRYGQSPLNFLEAERHPLVVLSRDRLCCLSLRFLEQKFSTSIHFTVLDNLPEPLRLRYLAFIGRVFECYVQRVCLRAFPDGRFVPGFPYGHPKKEAADGWIIYHNAAILLEAKAARFTIHVRLSGTFGSFESKFRKFIVKGARQLSRVIDDFRAGQFQVVGLNHHALPALYPVIVSQQYVPFDKFLTAYLRDVLADEGLLQQSGVRPLTVLHIEDLEHIEPAIAEGASFVDLLTQRLDSPEWQDWPFSNFLFDRFPDGLRMNPAIADRMENLLDFAGKSLFRLGFRTATPASPE